MGDRYISQNALISDIAKIKGTLNAKNVGQAIWDTPTADVVEVRHGEWGFDGIGWTCSECGEYALSNNMKLQVHSAYSPHCGAKMDGERSENGK